MAQRAFFTVALVVALVQAALAAWDGALQCSFNGKAVLFDTSVSRGKIYFKDQVSMVPGDFHNQDREHTRRIIAQIYDTKRLAPDDVRRIDLCFQPAQPTVIQSLDIWLTGDVKTPSFHGDAGCGTLSLSAVDDKQAVGSFSATVKDAGGKAAELSGGSLKLTTR